MQPLVTKELQNNEYVTYIGTTCMTTGEHRLPSILWWNILSNPSPLPVFPLTPWQQNQFPTALTDHVIYRVPLNILKFFIWLACDLLYPCTSLHLYSEVLCSHVLAWLITEVMPNNVIPFVMLFRIIVNLSPVKHDEGQSPCSCFVGFQAMPQSMKKKYASGFFRHLFLPSTLSASYNSPTSVTHKKKH